MPEQLFLPGFEAPPRPTDRLFFAILPNPDAAAVITRQARLLREEYGMRGRLIASGRLHVTLSYLGDYLGLPQALVAAAVTAGASVRAAPFELAFDRAGSFPGRPRNRPFVLLNGEDGVALAALHRTLAGALEKAGLGPANSRYTPHVTLLYDNRLAPVRPIAPIAWTVREFVLIHSLLGRSRHVPLARWPLVS
ncbi:MAG: 2-5 ligase [Herbaspirillum sp.]|jgi:2'-5' RNA ligase|nr:2-5 ligase [Herbaspirillum sp.]